MTTRCCGTGLLGGACHRRHAAVGDAAAVGHPLHLLADLLSRASLPFDCLGDRRCDFADLADGGTNALDRRDGIPRRVLHGDDLCGFTSGNCRI